MKPINKVERNKLFLSFLCFFIITVVLIVGAVFIDFQIPLYENKLLKAKYEQVNKELEFQTSFTKKMNDVKMIFDTINNPGQNTMYLDQIASTKLAFMKESIPTADSLKQRAMYDYIIQTLITLQHSKKNLREFKDSQSSLKEYEISLQRYKDALDQAKRDLDICRQLSIK